MRSAKRHSVSWIRQCALAGAISIACTPVLAGTIDPDGYEASASPRVNVYDPDEQFSKIRELIVKNGSATVLVVPHLDNLEWTLGPDGNAEFPLTQELETEYRAKAPQFVDSLPAQAIRNIAQARSKAAAGLARSPRATAEPQIELVVDLNGFLHLIARKDVRSVRMQELEIPQPVQLDPRVLETARSTGSAILAINLKTPLGYSPASGYMSKRAWDAQARSLRIAMTEIVTALSPEALPTLFQPEGSSGGFVQLPFEALRQLFERPDPRIKSVQLNEARRLDTSYGG